MENEIENDDQPSAQDAPLFRARKRRKVSRRTNEGAAVDEQEIPANTNAAIDEESPSASDQLSSIAALLRQRRPKPRRAGVEFSNTATQKAHEPRKYDTTLAQRPTATDAVYNKFTPQTGHITNANEPHM